MRKSKLYLIILIISLLSSFQVLALKVIIKDSVVNPAVNNTVTLSLQNLPDLLNVKSLINSAKISAHLTYSDNLSRLKLLEEDGDVSYDIQVQDQDGSVLNNIDLVSTYHNPEHLHMFDITENIGTTTSLSFNCTETGVNTHGDDSYNDYAKIIFTIEIDYAIAAYTENNVPISVVGNTVTDVTGTRRVDISWNSEFPYEDYDLEILKIYNNSNMLVDEASETSYIPGDIPFYARIDWDQALHVNVKNSNPLASYTGTHYVTSVRLALAEDGYYIYRIRPIGNYFMDEELPYVRADKRNYGEWNDTIVNQKSKLIDDDLLDDDQMFYFEDPSQDINYSYQRVFTEDGKLHEVMTFANGLNQVQQTQTYISSNPEGKKILLTQSILDYSGRPAINTLPVPIEGDLNTYSNTILNNSDNTEKFSARHFDTEDNYDAPENMSGEVADYYAGDDSPDANGYPYTRVLYLNDGTGRVAEQSGVGYDHRIGSKNTVKYEYTQPSEDELVRVFGEEAMPSSAVIKTITTDANGVKSVSYTTNEGTVLATAIEYELDDTSDQHQPFVINNRMKSSQLKRNVYVSQKTISVGNMENFQMIYRLNGGDTVEVGCDMFTINSCQLSLIVTVKDLFNNVTYVMDTIGISAGTFPLHNESWTIEGQENYNILSSYFNQDSSYKFLVTKKLIIGLKPGDEMSAQAADPQATLEKVSGSLVTWLDQVSDEEEMKGFYKEVKRLDMAMQSYVPAQSEFVFISERFSDTLTIADEHIGKIERVGFDRDPIKTPPNNLIVKSACCGEIKVPLNAQIIDCGCPNPVYKDSVAQYVHKFVDYLFDNALYEIPHPSIAGETLSDDAAFAMVCPGYTRQTLARMLYHMISDQYTVDTINDPTFQYTCEDLWECWKSNTSILNDMIDRFRDFNTGDNTNMRQDQEDDGDDQNESGKSQQDDGENSDHGGSNGGFMDSPLMKFIQWFYDFDMPSTEMDAVEADNSEAFTLEINYNFVDQFLTCAGYKFAKAITWEDPYPLYEDMGVYFTAVGNRGVDEKYWPMDDYFGIYEIDPADSSANYLVESVNYDVDDAKENNVGYNNKGMYYVPATGPFAGTPQLVYPQIKNPVYAFKYFEYGTVLPSFNISSPTKSVTLRDSTRTDVPATVFDYVAAAGLVENDWPFYNNVQNVKPQTDAEIQDFRDPYDSFYDYYTRKSLALPSGNLYDNYPTAIRDVTDTTDFSISDTAQLLTKRWYTMELNNCFINYEERLKVEHGETAELCDNPCSQEGDYKDWSYIKLFFFYNAIKDMVYERIPVTYPDSVRAHVDSYTDTELQELLDSIVDETVSNCESNCADKRNVFLDRVIKELVQNCYIIDDCAVEDAPDNVVTMTEINTLVDSMVADCQRNRCGRLPEISGDNYPRINEGYSCFSFLPQGIFTTNPQTVPKFEIFSDCAWRYYQMIMAGDVHVSLPSGKKGAEGECGTRTSIPDDWYNQSVECTLDDNIKYAKSNAVDTN